MRILVALVTNIRYDTTPPKKLVFWVSSKISLVKWISVPQCTQWLTFWRTNSAEGVLFHLLMYVDVWTCNSILKEIEGKNGRGRRCWKVLLLSSVQIKFSLMSRTCRQLPAVLSLKNESDMPRFFQATWVMLLQFFCKKKTKESKVVAKGKSKSWRITTVEEFFSWLMMLFITTELWLYHMW